MARQTDHCYPVYSTAFHSSRLRAKASRAETKAVSKRDSMLSQGRWAEQSLLVAARGLINGVQQSKNHVFQGLLASESV